MQIWPDGRYSVLDEEEFAEHAERFGYPLATQQAARQAVRNSCPLAGSPIAVRPALACLAGAADARMSVGIRADRDRFTDTRYTRR